MLLVIGDSNADAAARAGVFPREGEDVAIDDFGWSSGGAGVNVATAFARLGGRARLVSRTGTDAAAGIALGAAESAGVDLGFVQRDPAHTTGVCIVIVSPGGERTFLSHRGANACLETPDEGVWEGVGRLHACGHALLAGPQRSTALHLVAEAKTRGLPVSLDLCLPLISRYGEALFEQLPAFDLVFTNEAELGRLAFGEGDSAAPRDFDEAVLRLCDGGARTLVVKRGALGSVVARATPNVQDRLAGGDGHVVTKQAISAFEVTAVDSTGAGDAFVAAFLLADAAGQSFEACARLANAAGALQTSRAGSADVLPSRAEVAAFLAERGESLYGLQV